LLGKETQPAGGSSPVKPKSLVTIVLLTFVAVSVIALIAKEFGDKSSAAEPGTNSAVSTVEDRVVVYYFHGNSRCITCIKMEAYAREAIEAEFADQLNSGQMKFRAINVETASTEHFIEDYQLYSSSVVIVLFKDNMQVDWKNLSEVWELVHNKNAFLSYIQDETTALMQGGV
jgi:hypothetical protein